MKKILITGKNSYVGNNFYKYMRNYYRADDNCFKIDRLSLREVDWKRMDFSQYDVIFHVAGIAHVDIKKKKNNEAEKKKYYLVNRDLTINIAKKAKDEGVKQFIFMSSIIVYGDSAPIGKRKVITSQTITKASNYYGDSKIQAEEGIKSLQSEEFKIAIIRAPMIYGENCKGNFAKLLKLSKIISVFPNIKNQRSMIYIENLCELVRLIVLRNDQGIFFPQNEEYVQTSEMIKLIRSMNNKRTYLCNWVVPFIKLAEKASKRGKTVLDKVFGNLVYDKNLSCYSQNYQITSFEESIQKIER